MSTCNQPVGLPDTNISAGGDDAQKSSRSLNEPTRSSKTSANPNPSYRLEGFRENE